MIFERSEVVEIGSHKSTCFLSGLQILIEIFFFSTVKLGASLLKGKTPSLGNIKSIRQFLTILAGSFVSSGFGCTKILFLRSHFLF